MIFYTCNAILFHHACLRLFIERLFITKIDIVLTIVIRPDPEVDLVKEPGLELYLLTRVNPNQPGKIIIFFEVLIFHTKKLRNNSSKYRL